MIMLEVLENVECQESLGHWRSCWDKSSFLALKVESESTLTAPIVNTILDYHDL